MRLWVGLLLASACDVSGACMFNSQCPAGSFCLDGACAVECSDTDPCPTGRTCTPFGQCLVADAGSEPRDGGSDPLDAGGEPRDSGARCGDGVAEGAEECDDGNTTAGDGCEPSCEWTCEADADCGDADACNGADACVDHVCVVGAGLPLGAACDVGAIVDGVCRAGTCTARCDPLATFTSVVRVTELNSSSSDAHPKLSPDELTVYFNSSRPGGVGDQDIYFATRLARDAAFGAPELLPGVNTAGWEGNPSVTADGLHLYARARGGPLGEEVVVANRASPSASFGALVSLPGINQPSGNDYCPFVLPDHSALYFVSTRTGGVDIYRATREGGAFAAPVPVNAIDVNSPFVEDIVTVTPDERVIYFNSTRRNGTHSDVWAATRARTSDPFGSAFPVSAVNTEGGSEWPSWISPDACELLFTASGPAGDYDIYRATREP